MEQMDIMDHNPTTKAAKIRKEIENEIFRLDVDEVKQLIDAVSKVFVKNHHSKVLSEMTAKHDFYRQKRRKSHGNIHERDRKEHSQGLYQ